MKCIFIYLSLFLISGIAKAQSCSELFIDADFSLAVNAKTGLVYAPIIASDSAILNAFKFDEGPSPQRNMGITDSKGQIVITKDTKAIFEQKRNLTRLNPGKVIKTLEGYDDVIFNAVKEQFDFMLMEYAEHFPEVYEVLDGATLKNKLTGDILSKNQLEKIDSPWDAIEAVGKFVQEDWLLLKKDETTNEFVLIGGYLVFPTHWSLDRTLGNSISEIHNFLPGTPESRAQFSKMINMVLDRSLLDSKRVVLRNNWFLEKDPRYALPDYLRTQWKDKLAETEEIGPDGTKKKKESLCLRIERQTIRGLPKSGVALFSINPHVYDLEFVKKVPEAVARVRNAVAMKYDKNSPIAIEAYSIIGQPETTVSPLQPK